MADPSRSTAALAVLRAADGRRMPWKNGGGETTEIAVHPAAAGFDQVQWRVSMATLTADGPFSAFPGLDRTLAVIHGEGLVLSLGQRDPVRLDTTSEPLRFPGDIACTARLVSGPVTDLNVMTRRSAFRHAVRRILLPAPTAVATEATTLLVCCAGALAVRDRVLGLHDTLVSSGRATLDLIPRGPGTTAVLIMMSPV